jgi:uncharacterized protein (DUF952 family)
MPVRGSQGSSMSSPEDQTIYKVCTGVEWNAAREAGTYDGSADDRRDGFIHFSTWAQLPGTLAKHFNGQDGLVLLAFDADALGAALKWEPSRSGALFPHLYGALDPETALGRWPLALGADGVATLPAEASPAALGAGR